MLSARSSTAAAAATSRSAKPASVSGRAIGSPRTCRSLQKRPSVIARGADYDNPSNTPLVGVISGIVSTIYKVTGALNPSEAGMSPLWTSIKRCDFDGVKLAVSQNVDLNERNADGETPLTYIAKEGHYKYPPAEIPEFLVKSGADIEATNNNGNTPLEISLLSGWQNISDLMLKYSAKTDGVAAISAKVTCPVCKRLIAVYNLA